MFSCISTFITGISTFILVTVFDKKSIKAAFPTIIILFSNYFYLLYIVIDLAFVLVVSLVTIFISYR